MAVSDRARRGDLYGNRMAGELVVGHQAVEGAMKVAGTVAGGLGDKLKNLGRDVEPRIESARQIELRFENLEPQTLVGRLHFDYDATEEPRAQAIVEVF